MKWVLVILACRLAFAQSFRMPSGLGLRIDPRAFAGLDDKMPSAAPLLRQRKRDQVAMLFRRLFSRNKGSATQVVPPLLEPNEPLSDSSTLSLAPDKLLAIEGSATTIERSAEELWYGYETAEAKLAVNPDDETAQRECADSLCGWLRIMTDGNTVTIDGPGDTEEYRNLWREHAPRAVDLYRSILGKARADFDPEVPF